MNNWLSKRLTPAKSKESRWASFASTLETVWEEFFDPRLSRLERLRSSYLTDYADLSKKIREMGDYFTYDMPREEDRPVAVAWRRLELQNKDMELILKSVFRRHFGHLPVAWLPLFAPLDRPYGFLFEPYGGLGEDLYKNQAAAGMFLTSRGMLGVDKGALARAGMDKLTFREKARPLVMRTKPLHIVFDGFLWYIRFDLPFETHFSVNWENEVLLPIFFAPLGSRFDYTSDGRRPVDSALGLDFTQDVERRQHISFPCEFKELYSLALRHLSFDSPFEACLSVHWENETLLPLLFAPTGARYDFAPDARHSADLALGLDFKQEVERQQNIPFFREHDKPWRFDLFLSEGFPENWFSLDHVLPGYEAMNFFPVNIIHSEKNASFPMALKPIKSEIAFREKEGGAGSHVKHFEASASFSRAVDWLCNLKAAVFHSPDPRPLFDDVPADFMPLDFPFSYGGYASA